MTFTVTYRSADGAVREERVEAAGRGECFAQCRARGIVPIGVKEGWNGRGKTPTPDRKKNDNRKSAATKRDNASNISKTILAVVVLAVIACGVWWWIGRGKTRTSPEPDIPKKTALPKEVKPALTGVTGDVQRVKDNSPTRIPDEKTTKVSAPTATLGHVTKAIPAGAFDRVVDENGNVTYVKKKSPFTNRVDALVLSAIRPGGFPSGLRQWAKRHTKEELIAALKSPVNFNEDDSENMTASKHSLAEMKGQMVELLEKGHTLDEVLGEIEPTVNAERTERAKAEKTLRRLMKESDPATVREYVRCVNEELKAKGLKEIYLPKKFREEPGQESGQAGKENEQEHKVNLDNKEEERNETK